MRIYLDGCDGSGKSTLVKYLSQRFKLDIFCLTKDSEKSVDRYLHINKIDNVICDRTFMSEMVYPTVFGRDEWLKDEEIEMLFSKYKEDSIMLICTAPTDVILERLKHRGNEFPVVLEKIKTINRRYIEIANAHDVLVVDTNKLSNEIIGDYIERRLQKW